MKNGLEHAKHTTGRYSPYLFGPPVGQHYNLTPNKGGKFRATAKHFKYAVGTVCVCVCVCVTAPHSDTVYYVGFN